jgi:hypothetical protein
MPTEYEELKLVVSLDDRALAPLRQLNREIALIGGGPTNLPKARRELSDTELDAVMSAARPAGTSKWR